MGEEMKKYFFNLMKMVDGLHAIIITDRDGVPVIKVNTDDVPELALRARFLSVSGMAMDQAGKLGLGSNKTVVSMYGNFQVVSISVVPLIVTLIAASSTNTGMLLALEDQMVPILKDIQRVVDIA